MIALKIVITVLLFQTACKLYNIHYTCQCVLRSVANANVVLIIVSVR